MKRCIAINIQYDQYYEYLDLDIQPLLIENRFMIEMLDEWMDRWIDWLNGLMVSWTDGWIDEWLMFRGELYRHRLQRFPFARSRGPGCLTGNNHSCDRMWLEAALGLYPLERERPPAALRCICGDMDKQGGCGRAAVEAGLSKSRILTASHFLHYVTATHER